MMKIFLIIFFLFISNLALCQEISEKEKYEIFSKYLKVYQSKDSVNKINQLVVNQSLMYKEEYFLIESISEITKIFRGYIKRDDVYVQHVNFYYRSFGEILTKDTLWIPLVERLVEKIKVPFFLKDKFTTTLNLIFIKKKDIFEYSENSKKIDKKWKKFHKRYPNAYALVEFSDIVIDEKRCIFYFSSRCGGLCGNGNLVLFYKENNQWKFLTILNLWYS